MSLQIPFKLLEINVISAQDLAPVSKQLRTYVVAWVHPDDKLTTRVDHDGHTNPTWNYKLLFRVDDNHLYSDTSSITIEIYNMAWLRDTPVGTTKILIKHLIPPSSTRSRRKDPPVRHLFALQISRPSGQVQGILNLGVNLVDATTLSMPLSSELSVSTVRNRDQISSIGNDNTRESANSEVMVPALHRSQSARTTQSSVHGGSISYSIRAKDLAKSGSLCSYMHPIPSEVAAALKERGLYSIAGDDFGSSIFENWTELGGDVISCSPRSEGTQSKSLTWKSDDPLITPKKEEKRRIHRRSYSEGEGAGAGLGLFSCFGNAYGFEFNFSCGSKSAKKHKKRLLSKSNNNNNNNLPTVRSNESLRKLT